MKEKYVKPCFCVVVEFDPGVCPPPLSANKVIIFSSTPFLSLSLFSLVCVRQIETFPTSYQEDR
jgi:hypothetical protein